MFRDQRVPFDKAVLLQAKLPFVHAMQQRYLIKVEETLVENVGSSCRLPQSQSHRFNVLSASPLCGSQKFLDVCTLAAYTAGHRHR